MAAPVHALGTVANKQGRTAASTSPAATHLPGVLGTVTKVCDVEIGRTGLSLAECRRYGFGRSRPPSRRDPGPLPARAPETDYVKALAEVGTGRMLGAQIVGAEGTAKRIDVLATAIQAGMTAAEVVDLDLGYAPPFGPVWDPVHLVARRLLRALEAGAERATGTLDRP